ncbi:MAG: hypothetical protein ACTHMU_01985, partial [Thermomicrobiales bacterium]
MNRIVGKRLLVALCLVVLGLPLALWSPTSGALAAPAAGPEVTPAVHHDTSLPLRDIAPKHATGPQRAIPLRRGATPAVSPKVPAAPDPAVQSAPGGLATSTVGLNFPGVGMGDYGMTQLAGEPPDTEGAIGATQYVQWVNTSFAVFNKNTGAITYGPAAGNTIWAGFGGLCETTNSGDPIVKYDQLAQRWVFTQFAFNLDINFNPVAPYLQCVAVSTTSDALGPYNRYSFSYGSDLNDYGKLGVWPDAYYITFNMFHNAQYFTGPKVCAYDRNAMILGQAATQQCFQLSTNDFSLLPSDLDGANPPPPGAPNYLLELGGDNKSLDLWKFHVDWANNANTTLAGPTSISVTPFTLACNGGQCIPQPGNVNPLDSLGDRLMYRLAYRHFADGHEALVVNHSVMVNNTTTGVRWYELRLANGTPTVYQQSTFAPDGTSRWMGSVAMDGAGDIALGYSASSTSVFPSVVYTGRVPTDPFGQMQAETTIKAGLASQPNNSGLPENRWGDYSAMTIDPVDDCTLWYTNEYLKTENDFSWSTQIASFHFANCVPGATATTLTTQSATGPYNGTTTLTATLTTAGSTPLQGKTITFALNHNTVGTAVTDPNGVATLNNAPLAGIAVGSYPFGVTASFQGDGTDNGSSTNNSLTVTKADQTINFGTLAGHTADDAPFTVSASASSGLTVTFTASGVCTISGTTVTLTGAVGSCTITAQQAGDSNYNAAPDVPQTFAVTAGVPATITVTAGSGQSATVNTAFATALQATVLDDHGNPVNGTNVTFTAPASGASGTFQGGGTTATVTTDSNGVATAPTFTANGTPGTYSVTAAA